MPAQPEGSKESDIAKTRAGRSDALALVLAAVTVLHWSTTSTSVALAYRWGATPLQVLTWICFFALVFNTTAALLTEGTAGFRYNRIELARLAGLGVLGIFVYSSALYLGIHLGGPVYPLLTNYLWPGLLVLVSVWRRQCRVRRLSWLGLAMSFGGVCIAIIAQHRAAPGIHKSAPLGLLLGGVAAVSWALFSSYAAGLKLRAFSSQSVFNTSGMVCFLLVGLIQLPTQCLSWPCLAVLAYMGMLVNGLAYVLWLLALRMGSAGRVAPMVYLCPFLAVGMVRLILKEPVSAFTYAGLGISVLGVAMGRKYAHATATDDT